MHSLTRLCLRNCSVADARHVEQEPVGLNVLRGDLLHDGGDPVHVVPEFPEEVDVHRGPRERRSPHREHEGTLQHELRGVRRNGESVQELFQREVLQQLVERAR